MALYADNTVVDERLASGALAAGAVGVRSGTSGVSWAAIIAGAVGAAALSLVLLLLGSGLGLSMVSPWARQGASAAGIGFATIAWLSFTQLAASGMGGYLAGRLRSKWSDLQVDEIYFRDTAHGFLAWAVATLLTAALLGSAVGSVAGAGARAGAQVAGAAAQGMGAAAAAAGAGAMSGGAGSNSSAGPMGYYIDALFRHDASAPPPASAAPAAAPAPVPAPAAAEATPPPADISAGAGAGTGPPVVSASPPAAPPHGPAMRMPPAPPGAGAPEASRIFLNSIGGGALPPDDSKYLAQLVAQRTGLTEQQAQLRVDATYTRAQKALQDGQAKAKEAADAARKASAYAALWLVVSMLIGAFVASLAATWGGRRRDL